MEEKKKEEYVFNEEEFLKKVEKAARKGVNIGGIKNALITSLPTIIVIVLLAVIIIPKVNTISNAFKSAFHIDEPVENHDMTIENYGIFGHTVADFEEAVLGDSSKLKKIEVFKQEISDTGTITDTGLFNLGMFTKNQVITYFGTVVYTVDLSTLSKNDIVFDEDQKIITLKIPHAVQEEINIPEDRIKYNDPEKGLLAFGDIKATPEQVNSVQAEARKKMQDKLDSDKVVETADRFARLVVWELYSPIIKGVARDYSLEVEFR